MSPETPPARPDNEEETLLRQARAVLAATEDGQTGQTKATGDLPSHEQLEFRDAAQTVELRRTYATRLFALMVAQVAVADAVFVAYAWAGESWALSTSAIQAWLAATVVQIVGVFYVVTRNLFPNRDVR